MEYIDNCLYNGVELPALPEWDKTAYPYAYLYRFGDSAVAFLTINKVAYIDTDTSDGGYSMYQLELDGDQRIFYNEWLIALTEEEAEELDVIYPGVNTTEWQPILENYYSIVVSLADGPIWTNSTLYDVNRNLFLEATPIVRISTYTEEINAGVYKYWHFTFKDGDDNTLSDPKATYDLLITNDVTGDILTEADWINMNSFPKVYIYNTSPEHHTVRIMMTWEGTDGLKYRVYKNIIIGEAVAVEPDPEPEEPVVKPFAIDLKSFLTGLALGLSGKPLPPVKKEPVAYLYNGVRLPKLPEWDKEMYPYAYISMKSDGTPYIFISSNPASYYPNWGWAVTVGAWFAPLVAYANEVPWVSAEDEGGVYIHLERYDTWKLVWCNTDVVTQTGSVFMAASEPIPVYE